MPVNGHLEHADGTGASFSMPHAGLGSGEHDRSNPALQHCHGGANFDRVAQWRPRAVHLQRANFRGAAASAG
jgi:hypothetical protein